MSTRVSPCPRADVSASRAPHGAPLVARWTSGLLARLDPQTADHLVEKRHRVLEADFVGDLLVGDIDPLLRLSPRWRREAGARAREVGAAVRYAHLTTLDDLAYLYAAESSAGDLVRWLIAVGGVGLHRYRRWYDERAHLEDTSAWARELRAGYGSLLGDLYEVALHDDPAILGGIATRLGLSVPVPTRSLWEIAYPTGSPGASTA